MSNGISELRSNAESRVDRVVQTLDTGYSDVNKFQSDVMRTVEVREQEQLKFDVIRTVDQNTSSSPKITVEVRQTSSTNENS